MADALIADGIIAVQDLVKTYGADGPNPVRALRGVSFNIRRGECVAVMGSSGSGKSTLMNILGCLDRPTTGSYHLAGLDMAKESRKRLAQLRMNTLGFVFQNFQLLPRLTALQNVELPLQYVKGVSNKERRERAAEALTKVGLSEKLQRRPTELSGGQQQRVAIARALVNRPQVLLADEPTGNLDTATGLEVLALVQSLHKAGLTIILVTHEMDVAACASRRLVLRDGKMLSDTQQTPVNAAEQLSSIPVNEIFQPTLPVIAGAPV